MKVALVRPDNAMVVDGEMYNVDLSTLPEDHHAVRWNSETGKGEIEMVDEEGNHWGNKPIKDFSTFEHYITAWEAAKQKYLAEIEARKNATQEV